MDTSPSPVKKRIPGTIFGIVFIIIIIAGSLVRGYKLGDQSLWIDEGYSINAAQAILDRGYPILDSGEKYNGHIFSTYIIAGSMKLFGFDPYSPWSARLPSVLFGIATILMTYIFTFRLTGNYLVALGAMIFVAFLPWEIAWSRQARGYVMLQFFLLVSFDQLLLFMKEQKIKHGILGILFLVLAYLSQGIGIMFIPPVLVTLGIWLLATKQKVSKFFWVFIFGICAYTLYFGIQYLAGDTIQNYFSLYTTFLFQTYPIEAGLAIMGMISMFFFRKKKEFAVCIMSVICIPFIIMSIYQVVQIRYLIPLVPFICCMAVYGIYSIVRFVEKVIFEQQSRTPTTGIMSVAGIAIIMIATGHMVLLPRATYALEFGSPQPDFAGAYKYVQTNRQPTDTVVSTYAHLTKIYLKETGILLPISLTGKRSAGYLITESGKDFYTGAEALNGVPDTLNMIENGHGYIIIDSMAKQRLGKFFTSITQHPKTKQVYQSNPKSNLHAIWVYQF